MKPKRLYTLVGGSGTGKTTLQGYMTSELGFGEIVSITTRQIRKGETNGNPWYFVTEEEFEKADKIQESTYSGKRYGITKKEILQKFEKYDNIVFVCNKQAVTQMKQLGMFEIIMINITAPENLVEQRMRLRGDSEENIKKRIEFDKTENCGTKEIADYIIENIDLQKSKEQIKEIIKKVEEKEHGR